MLGTPQHRAPTSVPEGDAAAEIVERPAPADCVSGDHNDDAFVLPRDCDVTIPLIRDQWMTPPLPNVTKTLDADSRPGNIMMFPKSPSATRSPLVDASIASSKVPGLLNPSGRVVVTTGIRCHGKDVRPVGRETDEHRLRTCFLQNSTIRIGLSQSHSRG